MPLGDGPTFIKAVVLPAQQPNQNQTGNSSSLELAGIPEGDDSASDVELGRWAVGAGGGNVLATDSPFQAAAANPLVPVDTTGGAVVVRAPLAPFDGQNWGVKDATGNAAVTPINLTSAAGISFELPNNPGNYGQSGFISTQGASIVWKFSKAQNRWIAWVL